MRKRVDVVEANKRLKKEKIFLLRLEEYEEAVKTRGVAKEVGDKIISLAKEVIERYPSIQHLKLIGSYAKNSYIDKDTPVSFIEAKKAAGLKVKISDFDFETFPVFFDRWVSHTGDVIHLCTDREGVYVNLDHLLRYDS